MKHFLASLFDFKFETYVTKQVASVLYAIIASLTSIATVLGVIYSISQFAYNSSAIFMLFAAPIAGLLILTVLRVAFESSIALVDIAINTKK